MIIDASFSKTEWRKSVVELTERLEIPLYFIQTQAPKNVIEQRLLVREKQKNTISDGRLDILDRFISDIEEPFEISKKKLIAIDTTKPILENIEFILNEILSRNLR